MTTTLRRWLISLLLLIAAAAGLWLLSRPHPITVTVKAAEPGVVERSVANTRAGTVMACRRAKLATGSGGQIATLKVTEGDRVKRGDLLLELWNNDLQAELVLAQQDVESADASARAACFKAELAASEAERQRSLRKRKLVSEEESERAYSTAESSSAECEAARHQIEMQKAKLGVAEAKLEKTRLFAPFDGIIAEVHGELNEYITPSPPGIPTLPAVDLIDDRCFYVTAPIDEVDVAEVAVGQPARITLDAFDERRFEGRVRRIAPYVLDLEKQARTVDVEIEFGNPDELREMLAGYSADVEIILAVRDNVLRIPTEALLEDDRLYLLNAEAGVIEQRKVTTGSANWDYTEITGGLEAGALVVTSVDTEGLEDGVRAQQEVSGKP